MKKIIEDIFKEYGSNPVKDITIFKIEIKGNPYLDVLIQDKYLIYNPNNGLRTYCSKSSDIKEGCTLEDTLSSSTSEIIKKIKEVSKDEEGVIQTSDGYRCVARSSKEISYADGFEIGGKRYLLIDCDFDTNNDTYASIKQKLGIFGAITIYNLDCYTVRVHGPSHEVEIINERKEK